jgi:phosphatidylinositol alpha-1,6-mannosyltransferase
MKSIINNDIKIGYVTTTISPEDGWGRYSGSLIGAVSKRLNVIVVASRVSIKKDVDSKTQAYNVLPDATFRPTTQLKVFFYCIKYLKDVNVIHSLVEPFSPGAALAAYFLRVPFIMTLHGTYSIPPRSFSIKRILMKYMYNRVTIATTGSPYTEKKVRDILNFGECRFIPNGVDDNIFYKIPKSNDKNYLLTVGGLKARKGTDLVVEALSLVKDKFPSLHYKIVGLHDDKNFISSLKANIDRCGLNSRVEFLDSVSDTQLRTLYNECSIFILAAREVSGSFEGFPMVFYEANACGVPVITTSGFGSEYAIKDGINGYIVPQNNPQKIADSIIKILDDKYLYDLIRNGALNEAKKHTWENISGSIINLYEDALKKVKI